MLAIGYGFELHRGALGHHNYAPFAERLVYYCANVDRSVGP